MGFVSGVTWRSSQRGLVVCGPGGSSLLIEHERAGDLPALLDDASDVDELSSLLGGSDAGRQVVADLAIGLLMVAGTVTLIVGHPEGPQVSAHPWVDATVGMLLGFGLAVLHELAHAVALVHYGRTPRSAGCGFYWGALCFYVDSSDGTTLPRRARIIDALAGLAEFTAKPTSAQRDHANSSFDAQFSR